MKGKRSNTAGVIALLVIGAAGVYGLGAYLGKTPEAGQVASNIRRAEALEDHSKPEPPKAEETTAKVLTPVVDGENLTFKVDSETVPTGKNPMVFAVNRYFETSHIMPSGAKVLSVEVKDETAYFDCTEQAEKTFGAMDERTLLQGIAKTLQQFPTIKKFQFLISGTPIETWGGVDMTQPLTIESEAGSTTTPEA
jgi:hypothetical protein